MSHSPPALSSWGSRIAAAWLLGISMGWSAELSNVHLTGGEELEFQIQGTAGRTHVIETSADLNSWQPAATNAPSLGSAQSNLEWLTWWFTRISQLDLVSSRWLGVAEDGPLRGVKSHTSLFAALLSLLTLAAPVRAQKTYTFGMIAKSQGNMFFQAARSGAEDAARELGAKYGLKIKIDWRTPNEEDAQKQAGFIEQLVLNAADGIIISCSDANKVTDAINNAVAQGVPVATFSGDAPASKRFVSLGIDDYQCGYETLEQLSKQLGGKGLVAAICGNPNALNLQQRAAGFRAAAKKYPGIRLLDVFYHKETPQDAVAKIEQVMQANPDIAGWGLLGGWPLFTDNALHWPPGSIKCVCVDALPPQLPYVRSGHVQLLLSQGVYDYGYRAVEHLVNRIHFRKAPERVLDNTPLTPVTQANVDAFAKNWEKWLPK